MDICPVCRTALYLKHRSENELVYTCRNRSCSNYMKDVFTEKIEPDETPEEAFE